MLQPDLVDTEGPGSAANHNEPCPFCKVDSYQAHAYDCFAKLMREWSTVDMKAIDDGTWSLVLSAELPLVFVARYGINGHPENG